MFFRPNCRVKQKEGGSRPTGRTPVYQKTILSIGKRKNASQQRVLIF